MESTELPVGIELSSLDTDTIRVAQRYKELEARREPFLRRARECAALTLPYLLAPWDGDVSNYKLPTPYTSVGAAGVNNLAAKLLLTLYPPNGNFFRLMVTSFDLEALILESAKKSVEEQGGGNPEEIATAMREEITNELDSSLGKITRAVVEEYEMRANRATDFEAFKHLVALGNVLRYVPQDPKEQPRIYGIHKYVVKRAPEGDVLEIITKELVSPMALPKELRDHCDIPLGKDVDRDRLYELYTYVFKSETPRGTPQWVEIQELNGKIIEASKSTYRFDKCPWLALRWSKVDGEDYGRGHVESYLGDLVSADGLRKALVDGAIGAARLLFLADPASSLRPREIAEAPNGAVLSGAANSLVAFRVDKQNDFTVAERVAQGIEKSLGQAFLLTTSIQRSGERVTAEEIRTMANELEQGLGGNYSTMAKEYQLPVVTLLMYYMQRSKKLPELPKEVRPIILTGMQALGRNADLERLVNFLKVCTAIPGDPSEIQLAMKVRGIVDRVAGFLDVDTTGILNSEEEVAQAKQAMQQQAMAQQLAKPAMDMMAAQQTNQPPPQQ